MLLKKDMKREPKDEAPGSGDSGVGPVGGRTHPKDAQGLGEAFAGKSAETRQRIFSAAVKVFTSYPYSAASIRMIGDEAGVRHPLVLHYFGSKLALFEEVAKYLEDRVLDSGPPFLKNLRNLSSDEGFDRFLDDIINHGFKRTESYRAIMLNMGEARSLEKALPGLNRMTDVREKAQKMVGGRALGGAPPLETEMFLLVFILSLSHFVGAADFHRMALGIESEEDYRSWVHETFRFLFRPVLKVLSRNRPTSALQETPQAIDEENSAHLPHPTGPADRDDEKAREKAGNGQAGNGGGKSEETRKRIIRAARKVFSRHPYNAASIRMIGQAGNFDFTKIHHFYPTKEHLFEAVAKDLFEEFTRAAEEWRVGLTGLDVNEIFALYLKRALDYIFKNPEAIGLLMHNIPQYARFRHVVGFDYIARFHARMLYTIKAFMPPDSPEQTVRLWLYTIITMVYTFAGSPDYLSNLMGVPTDSDFYRRRIYETLVFVFMPSFFLFTNQIENG